MLYPETSKDEWSIYRKLPYIASALLLPLTSASHHTHSYDKLSVEADELTQPSRMKQHAEALSAPFPALSLPCLVGEEGTYVPLVTAALYVCATNGRSWDADSRISLAGSMLPSSLPREVLVGGVICLDVTQLQLHKNISSDVQEYNRMNVISSGKAVIASNSTCFCHNARDMQYHTMIWWQYSISWLIM